MLTVLIKGNSSKYLYIKATSNIKLREQMLFFMFLHIFGEATETAGWVIFVDQSPAHHYHYPHA